MANVVAAIACLLCEGFCRYVLRSPQPFTSPVLPGWGGDFRYWVLMMRQMHTAAFATTAAYPFLYPPAAAPFQYVFAIIPWKPTLFFYLANLGIVGATVYLFGKALARAGVRPRAAFLFAVGMAAVSFPLWFVLRQGNIELLLFAFTAGGTWAYLRRRDTLAAFCFGIAGAAKLYPLVFLGLFVARRQWRALLLAIVTALLATVASLWMIHPHLRVALEETGRGLAVASTLQFLQQNAGQGGFDHSMLGAYKRLTTHFPPPEQARVLLRGYVLVLGTTGLLAFFVRLRKLSVLNQVLGFSTAAVTFMPLSYDYTLVHMYIPFGMLALCLQRGAPADESKKVMVALGLFALVFSPLSEFIYHGTTVGGLVKTAALAGLFLLSVSGDLLATMNLEPLDAANSFSSGAASER